MVSSRASIFRRLPDAAGAIRHYRGLIGLGSTRAELLARQRRRLVETARRAWAASPLYRVLYSGPELTSDLDIRELPVVTKAMLVDHFDDWVTDPRLHLSEIEAHVRRIRGDELHLGEYRCVASAGTSGRMGIFVYDRSEWREYAAVMLRRAELMGLRRRSAWRPRAHRRDRRKAPDHQLRQTHTAAAALRAHRQGLAVDHAVPMRSAIRARRLTGRTKRRHPPLQGRRWASIALHPLTLRSPMAGLVELRQYKIILADDGLRVLVTPGDGIVPDQIAQRIEATLSAKLLEAGVADPRLKVELMPELPRDQGGAKFKLIESRTSTTR